MNANILKKTSLHISPITRIYVCHIMFTVLLFVCLREYVLWSCRFWHPSVSVRKKRASNLVCR